MFAFQLLLSPNGRMKRLNYVLLSGFIGAMNFGLLTLVGLQSGASLMQILEGGPLFLFQASPILAGVCLLGIWFQVCFVFKRSRDFSGGTLAAWLFVAFWAAPYVVPLMANEGGALTSNSMLKFALAVPAAIVGMVLFFADTKDEALTARTSDSVQEAEQFGDIDDSTDLVARAAALRAMDAAPSATRQTVQMQPIRAKPAASGFGRRKTFAG
ncbi:MAG: hypothetical protein ABJH63_11285 [Rhizobiaceae bacterium]